MDRASSDKKSPSKESVRLYKMDNIRFLLIFLVVFAHLLEGFSGRSKSILYTLIYSFHMPAFLFLTGYFARFSPRRILRHLFFPYVVFQVLYLLFQSFVLDGSGALTIQFTTPYWLLWYLFAVVVYYMLIPLLQTDSAKKAVLILSFAFAVSLLCGFDSRIGYYLSLSRILVFFPFFCAGLYAHRFLKLQTAGIFITIAAALSVLVWEFLLFSRKVPVAILHGSYSYAAAGAGIGSRALFLLCASSWILLLFSLVPDRKIPLVSRIGESTMQIFLLHGFAVKLLVSSSFFRFSTPVNLVLAAGITAAILLFCSLPLIKRIFNKVF